MSMSISVIGFPLASCTGFASTSMLEVLIAGYEAPDRLASTEMGVDVVGISTFGNGEAVLPLPPTKAGVSLLSAAFLRVARVSGRGFLNRMSIVEVYRRAQTIRGWWLRLISLFCFSDDLNVLTM